MDGGTIFTLIFVVFIVVCFIKAVNTVNQGFEYTVERFGEYRKTLRPGLHFIIPFFDSIGA
ncbi:MAG: SPFH/Band 7/PHB domain protein, partial [Gammaproteobacteria bacterium]|nr:SPFH/Band 7/PHB domain protein [Gammaproteobacteria bacterium]